MSKSQRLRQADLARLTDAVAELYCPSNPNESLAGIVRPMARLLEAPFHIGVIYESPKAGFPPNPEAVTNYGSDMLRFVASLPADSITVSRRRAQTQPFEGGFATQMFTPAELRRQIDYQLLQQLGLADSYDFGILLPGLNIGAALQRFTHYGPREHRLIELLKPHIVRAVSARHSLRQAFADVGSAVFVFDSTQRCQAANTPARKLLGDRDTPRLFELEELATLARHILSQAQQRQLDAAHDQAEPLVWRGLIVEYCLTGAEPAGVGDHAQVVLTLRPAQPVAPPSPTPSAPKPAAVAALVARFGLSAAETPIAHRLAQGLSEKEIAAKVQRTRHTVKFHIANIHRKCQVTSRAEWMALLAGEAAPPS